MNPGNAYAKIATEAAALNPGAAHTKELDQIEYAKLAMAQCGDGNVLYVKDGFWRWDDGGVWRACDDCEIRQLIHSVLPEQSITANKVESILKLARTESYSRVDFGGVFDGINCQNGELLFRQGQWRLEPHNKERYLISQIPVAYDPTATAPRFKEFLEEIYAGDQDAADKIQATLEYMGYSLLPNCRYEKFVILIGSGANGKSVLLGVLKDLCGPASVAAVQPDQMGSPFQRGYLHGKLANLVTEIAEGAVINDAALKAITSGELMTGEQKFRDPFTFQPYATCWFGTNHMPHTRDFSDAVFRRAGILTFNNKFEGGNCDPRLKESLVKELPGILNMALHGLGCVLQSGTFTTPESTRGALSEWRVEADQVRQFVEERCYLEDEIVKGDLYRHYRRWCDGAGVSRPVKQRTFTNRLKLLGVGERRTGTARYYQGISLADSTACDTW